MHADKLSKYMAKNNPISAAFNSCHSIAASHEKGL